MDFLRQQNFTSDHNNFILTILTTVILGLLCTTTVSTKHISTTTDGAGELTPSNFYNSNPDYMYHFDGNTFHGKNYTVLACLTSAISLVGIALGIIVVGFNNERSDNIKNFESGILFLLTIVLVAIICVNNIPGTSHGDGAHVYNVESSYDYAIVAIASIILGVILTLFLKDQSIFSANKIYILFILLTLVLLSICLMTGNSSSNVDDTDTDDTLLTRKFNTTERVLLLISIVFSGICLGLGLLKTRLVKKSISRRTSPRRTSPRRTSPRRTSPNRKRR